MKAILALICFATVSLCHLCLHGFISSCWTQRAQMWEMCHYRRIVDKMKHNLSYLVDWCYFKYVFLAKEIGIMFSIGIVFEQSLSDKQFCSRVRWKQHLFCVCVMCFRIMERSEFRWFHRPISSDASILRTHSIMCTNCGSIRQRLASFDVGQWNSWNSERSTACVYVSQRAHSQWNEKDADIKNIVFMRCHY